MPALTDRQHRLLTSLVEEYVSTAEPVASQALVGQGGLDVSPATVRNDLVALEEAGYLAQPHTSAGRVPTERAWRTYVAEIQADRDQLRTVPRGRELSRLRTALHQTTDAAVAVKALAKALVDLMDEAVIVAFSPGDVYYTGLSNLFRQPEFDALREVLVVSTLVDRLDEVVADLYPSATDEVAVLMGHENPLGEHCGLLLTRYHGQSLAGVIAALGPLRQPYRHHLPLLRSARELINEIV